mgnify:FL=1
MKYLIIGLVSLLLISCEQQNTTPRDSDKLSVYTSFYAIYDFVGKIGGDKIELINLVPPGTEPHSWEPSAKDMIGLEHADLFFYNGLGLESFADKISNSLNNGEIAFVELSEKIVSNNEMVVFSQNHEHDDEEHGQEEHSHGEFDPHVWLSPKLALKQMEVVKNTLVERDPENEDYYKANFDKVEKKIYELDEQYKEAVEGFKSRTIIVSHEAYGYLCREYDL